MKVLLISANTEQINIIPLPLGLNCVAVAARNAGHEVRVLDLMHPGGRSVAETIRSFQPDIIGISVRNIDDQNMEAPRFFLDEVRKVIDGCRNLSAAPVILGGAGYSIFPESALEYLGADMGIQGEGEEIFPLLLERIGKGQDFAGIPGLYVRGAGLQGARKYEEMDALPLPDALISSGSCPDFRETWMPVQTRRGCPMDCMYCSTGTIEGRTVRKRSPDLVLKGIAAHVEAGFRTFYFVDNTFNLPLSYAKELCRRLLESGFGVTWRCIVYPGRVDEELVDLMARSGCVEVSLGFESGCERILHIMNKKFSHRDVIRASRLLRDAGIKRIGFLLLGGPGETNESVEESLAFADSLELDALKLTVGIRIYPGTRLADIACEEGVVSPEDHLLLPRFYLKNSLDGWLQDTVRKWMDGCPHWMG